MSLINVGFKFHSKIIKDKDIISYFNFNPRPTELTLVNFVNMLIIRVYLLFTLDFNFTIVRLNIQN